MFKFKKKEAKRENLYAVVDGRLMPIEEVKDPVFSQKMMGDGFAIDSDGDTIYACADGEITMLFPTNHAIGLKLDGGMEVLIHVGIDTVNENGAGFSCFCKQGAHVTKGEALLKMDREYLKGKGYDLTVVVVFTDRNAYQEFQLENVKDVKGKEALVATYTPAE